MIIQINTDNHITVHETFEEELDALISDKLSRFSKQLTRVEVHLSDENSHKEGSHDKRCLMEARMEGMAPIVVTEKQDTIMQAINMALDTLKATLTSAKEKARNY